MLRMAASWPASSREACRDAGVPDAAASPTSHLHSRGRLDLTLGTTACGAAAAGPTLRPSGSGKSARRDDDARCGVGTLECNLTAPPLRPWPLCRKTALSSPWQRHCAQRGWAATALASLGPPSCPPRRRLPTAWAMTGGHCLEVEAPKQVLSGGATPKPCAGQPAPGCGPRRR